MAKIRKFDAGGNTRSDDPSKNQYVDPEEARYKAAGLAASNAELESGKRKPSGFLGLGRFLEGNIDQKGSEAYNLYGAGYGREVEATNTRLKEKTEREAAADEKRRSDKARDAGAAASEDDYETKNLGAGNRPLASELAAASATRAREAAAGSAQRAREAAAGSGSGSGATTPDRGDKGARSGAAPAASGSAASGAAASGSGGGRGPTYAQVDAEKQKGFTASSTSTDPAQRAAATAARAAAAAKAAADAPKVRNPETDEGEDVRPASQAQLKALAAIARATGDTSGVASGRITAAEAARKITEYAKKAKDTASSFSDFFKKEKYKAKGGAIQSYAKGGSVSASSRGDGIAQRGKTRGRMC
jgi:hypothetical protein